MSYESRQALDLCVFFPTKNRGSENSNKKNLFEVSPPSLLGTITSHVPWSRLSRFFGDGRPPTFDRNPYFMCVETPTDLG